MGRACHFSVAEVEVLQLLHIKFPNRSHQWLAGCLGRSVSAIRSHLASRPLPKKKVSENIAQRRRRTAELAGRRKVRRGRVVFDFPSCASIARVLGVSKTTVWRDFTALGWVSRVRTLVPTVSADDLRRRVLFARKHVHADPKKIMFTDEVILHSNDNHLCRTQWLPKHKKPEGRLRSRWPTARVMVHGAIAHNFRHLVIFDSLKGDKLTAESYKRKVLFKLAPLCVEKKLQLQQDGARPHIARQNMEYLRRKDCAVVDGWPPRSPQLNVIEQLWPILHAAIARRTPQTQEELVQYAVEEWNRIPQSKINALIKSFTKKCEKCIKQKGQI